MTVENFDMLLEEFRNAKPYRIFTVELHSGQRFEVDHPEAMVRRRGVAVFLSFAGRDTEILRSPKRQPVHLRHGQ